MMTDDDKALVERLEEWEWTLRAVYKAGDLGTDEPAIVMSDAADRIEALSAENERLREELAAAYVKLSGRTEHASDCATSNAPAKDPGPCDCGPPDDVRRAIEVELAMTAIANEDASSDWIDGFEHAWKRVKAVLGDKT